MTKVATTLRSAYLAGPMRGIEDYNFPEFLRQAKFLRACGWTIFSPAERDMEDPNIDHETNVAGWTGERGLDYFMAHDLKAVCEHDAVICLPGWEASQGARLETVTAVEIGHPVFELMVDKRGQGVGLKSINPEYVLDVFSERGPIEGWEVEGHKVDTVTQEEFDAWRDAQKPCPTSRMAEAGDWDCHAAEVSDADVKHAYPTALPTDSAGRKATPLASGVLDYFPAALAEVAKVSKAGNDKHNPGQPLHHARGKSTDHADSLLRHLVDRGSRDPETGQLHSAEVAWRALALLQQELEDFGLAPLPRGARLP